MSDDPTFYPALRELIAHQASHDPQRVRFGARHHRYRVGPPLAAARLAEIEAALGLVLPADYRGHLLEVGDGGAGPYHGLMPLDHPLQLAAAAGDFDAATPYRGAVGLAHLGCGYVAVLVVRGPARGQVWLDARGAGDGVILIDPDFRTFYMAWVKATASQRWERGLVTRGRCALPSALTAYLHTVEDRLGVARDQLAGAQLREALSDIPDGGIAVTSDGDTPFYAAGELVDLCVTCEQTVDNLAPSGMRRAQVQPGLAPLPMRDRDGGATADVTAGT